MIYSQDLERQLLSGLLNNPEKLAEIRSFISADDFYSVDSKVHQTIFNVIDVLYDKQQKVSDVIVSERIKELGVKFEDDISITEYIQSLSFKRIKPDAIIIIAKELKKYTVRRDIWRTAKSIGTAMTKIDPALSSAEILDQADKIFNSKADRIDRLGSDNAENIYDEMMEIIEERGENPVTSFGIKMPFKKLEAMYGSLLRPGNISVIVARSKAGKMQPLRSQVLTPDGFKRMSDLKIGDAVATPAGGSAKIDGIFDHQNKEVYTITLEDGRKVEAGLEHLWKASVDGENWEVRDTSYLIDNIDSVYLPLCSILPPTVQYAAVKGIAANCGEKWIPADKDDVFEWIKACHAYGLYARNNGGVLEVDFEKNKLKVLNIEKNKIKEDCRCISLDNEEHLYFTDGFVVTHNTAFTMNLCLKCMLDTGTPVIHFDMGEMSKEELIFRQCSAMSGVPCHYIETGKWRKNKEMTNKIRAVWPLLRKDENGKSALKHYYYSTAGLSPDEMAAQLKRVYYSLVGRGNEAIFLYDYIKTTGMSSNGSSEWAIVGEIVDKFKKCIQKDILNGGKPVISMITAAQANRAGIITNKKSEQVVEDESVIGLSDRIAMFASSVFLLRKKTLDELAMEKGKYGTHKLINLVSRHLGEDVSGALDMVMVDDKPMNNFLHFEIDNFLVTEMGDLRDSAREMSNIEVTVEEDDADSDLPPSFR